ncbi:transposase [Streptomyces sp. S1D4-11]
MAALAVARRLGLTDEQWARLEPLLPVPTWSGRASAWTKRQLIDGITWRVRVNAPWRDVPECYGSRPAVYALFRRWQRAKAWAQIVTALQPRADTASSLITRDVSVDSTIARAHQHAAKHPPTPWAAARAARRSLGRTGRPRTGTLPRRADHQDSPGV